MMSALKSLWTSGALPPADALAEIRRCGGTHYDPDVVAALDAVADRVGMEHIHELSAPLDPHRDTGPTPGSGVSPP